MNDAFLRNTFDSQAELYHEARPKYPTELFDELIQSTCLHNNAHLLEIGPGTGQATAPLAERGYHITAIELGGSLAKIARRELAKHQNVEVITGAFEEMDLPLKSFDLVYAATAFHWIKPDVKFIKSHELLKDDGHLTIIHTNHITNKTDDEFFYSSQPIYQKYRDNRPKSTKDSKSPLLQIEDLAPDVFNEKLFEQIFFKVFPVSISYTADEYVKLIATYSPTIAMPQELREAFLDELRNLINNKFDGHITKHYGMTLTIGRKIK
jgi:ubiquinone/menaquinone biosynthesis C-methylase UbiE